MKCNLCHRHFKQVNRNLDDTLTCPDCSKPYDTIVQLGTLFEEILINHVALAELREVYRRHYRDIVAKNEQKQAK